MEDPALKKMQFYAIFRPLSALNSQKYSQAKVHTTWKGEHVNFAGT